MNSCGNISLLGEMKTTITMTKNSYKNESTMGRTSFYGEFVLNLSEIFWKPLQAGAFNPMTKNNITPNFHYFMVEGNGVMPVISQIPSNIKFEIFVKNDEMDDHFQTFYSTWNNNTGNEYIPFSNFWNYSNYEKIIDNNGLDVLNDAYANERDEIYMIFKVTFEDYIEEDLLDFNYFDIDIIIPYEIKYESEE